MPNAKPLPVGYVCKLCGGDDHAVYDCSLKKKRKELEEPPRSSAGGDEESTKIMVASGNGGGEKETGGSNKTVHLSGLPFDTTKQSLEDYLRKQDADEGLLPLSHHSLKYFEDNPKKCKGVAYLMFSCQEFASNAIEKLNGKAMGTKELRAAILIEKKEKEGASSDRKSGRSGGREDGDGARKEKAARCFRCGSKEHGPKECTNERICYRCMGTDHLAAACPQRHKRHKTLDIKKE